MAGTKWGAVAGVVIVVAVVAGVLLYLGGPAQQPAAPQTIRIKHGTLAFPSYMSMMEAVIRNQSLDKKNGLEIEWVKYGAIPAFYGGLATGEVDVLGGGPHVAQRMRNDGTPVQIIGTYATLTLYVVAKDPAINSLRDLRGKTIAVDTGASDYQILSVYARTQGIKLPPEGNDINVRGAAYPIARTEFEEGRVEAAVLVEPHVALAKRRVPTLKVIWDGNRAWKEITGFDLGWYLVLIAREDLGRTRSEAVSRLIKTYNDVEDFLRKNPQQADAIITSTLKLPPGIIADSLQGGRTDLRVRPAWESAQKTNIEEMFRLAVITGFIPKLPEAAIIYAPRTA